MREIAFKLFCLLTLLSGCAQHQVVLRAQALTVGSTKPRQLAIDDTLHTQDQFRFQVEVPQPAYVYLARPNKPVPTRVFPDGGTNHQVRPEASLFIPGPGPGKYFQLSGRPGRESAFVIASVQPLTDSEINQLILNAAPATAREAAEDTAGDSGGQATDDKNGSTKSRSGGQDTKTPEETKPPPGPADPIKRGDRYVVKARLDARHPAVLFFSFYHALRAASVKP